MVMRRRASTSVSVDVAFEVATTSVQSAGVLAAIVNNVASVGPNYASGATSMYSKPPSVAPASTSTGGGTFPVGGIAGIAAGGVVIGLIAAAVVVLLRRRSSSPGKCVSPSDLSTTKVRNSVHSRHRVSIVTSTVCGPMLLAPTLQGADIQMIENPASRKNSTVLLKAGPSQQRKA